MRALSLNRASHNAVAARKLTFELEDSRGNKIFRQSSQTSKFGIAATDCALASEILEGPYTIQCKTGDTDSKLTVDVKKYVLPKFKVTTQIQGEEIRVSGKNRDDLQAVIAAVRGRDFPAALQFQNFRD